MQTAVRGSPQQFPDFRPVFHHSPLGGVSVCPGTGFADVKDMPEPQGSPAPNQAAPGRTKLLLTSLVILALGAGGIFWWTRPANSANAEANATAVVASTLALDTFVVNVGGADQRAYLRVGITLGLSRPPAKANEALPVALVRDTILSVLTPARPEQLLQAEGKQKLKADLLAALKERVPQLGVEDVYFTEFLVQM